MLSEWGNQVERVKTILKEEVEEEKYWLEEYIGDDSIVIIIIFINTYIPHLFAPQLKPGR